MSYIILMFIASITFLTAFQDNDAVLCCEILKALFNLFIEQKDEPVEESDVYSNLLDIVRKLLESENAKENENLVRYLHNSMKKMSNDL